MSPQARSEYLVKIASKYQKATKSEKVKILDQAEEITDLSRDHLRKKLWLPPEEIPRRKGSGRPRRYQKDELLPHIKELWKLMEEICAPRMKAGLDDWLAVFDCPQFYKMQIRAMSASTLGRYLYEVRKTSDVKKGLSSTCPAKYMKNKVPINTLDSKVTEPGHVQADTVAHCGTSLLGAFINSLTVTDIFSTWTENRAIYTKKATEVKTAFSSVERALPFTLKSMNTDSGSEFLNQSILKFTNHGTRIKFTRSRPYKKNDNCYVEQKNFTHVRGIFGYQRYDDPFLVHLMNDIYTNYWNPLQNFFLPTFKLKEKVRIGGKIKKKYGPPMTPYQRLMLSSQLTETQKQELQDRKAQLNPIELKKGLEKKLKEFFEIVRRNDIRKVA